MRSSKADSKKKQQRLIALAAVLLIVAAAATYLYVTRPDMNDTVTLEAGGTVPPVEAFISESRNPGTFVTDVTKIDTKVPGEYEVKIKIGYFTYKSVLAVVDTTPPTIEGVKDLTVIQDATISYKKDVTVQDNLGGEVTLAIDSSDVNLKVLGKYQVVYVATDESGNSTQATANVNVVAKPVGYVDQAMVDELADAVLAKIIKSGMTDMQKLRAIFDYSREHITYTGHSDKSDWLAGAYRGFVKADGDCFNYYCVSRALLVRAGYEVIPVVRVPEAPSRHYWCLVKYQGAWYHFDACLYRTGHFYECLMKTDAQVAEYSEEVPMYYAFDPSKYPATPTVPIN